MMILSDIWITLNTVHKGVYDAPALKLGVPRDVDPWPMIRVVEVRLLLHRQRVSREELDHPLIKPVCVFTHGIDAVSLKNDKAVDLGGLFSKAKAHG